MPDVVMPRLSDSMEEGTIVKWLKADGDAVARGDELVEIETDKATMTYEADQDGTLKIVADEGATLPIGEVIATIGEGGSDNGAAPAADEPAADAQPAPDQAAAKVPDAPAVQTPPTPQPAATAGARERVKASPVARRMARELGLDLSTIAGSGPKGRVVKADVEHASLRAPQDAAAATTPTAPAPAPPPPAPAGTSEPGTAKGETRIEELSKLQQVVARRMAESKATVPEFTISTTVDMTAAVDARKQLKAVSPDAPAPSYNDMVVKACALALREYPRANGAYKDAKFELYSRVNVGIAVAAADSLVVPTIFDADRKTLGEISRDARALAERVRAKAITPPELSGGTFTVSNLGMFGVTNFEAVINAPQAAILAVGALEERAVVREGAFAARSLMDVTLTCDHRILYGADAAQFLARVRELLEHPLGLAL